MSESDGDLGDDLLSEVLERGSLHLVVTEVISVGGGAEQRKKKGKQVIVLFSRPICEGLRRSGQSSGVVKVEVDVLGSRPGRKATLEPKGLEFSVLCCEVFEFCWSNFSFVCWKGF